jgi:ADP-heptose:LPS heptosyltransferase
MTSAITSIATEHILVIKHGALGDVILATGAMKSIRAHHPHARLTLLTTKPYAALLEPWGLFDGIWVDNRPKWYELAGVFALANQLRSRPFMRVYDLQTSDRSSSYLRLFLTPKPEWSGIAVGASHRHATPERTSLHTIDRESQQLQIAGIAEVFPPDIAWMHGTASPQGLTPPYALIVAGGSAHRPEKRYPEVHYITLAGMMAAEGVQPVLIGGGAEAELLSRIATAIPSALNVCNQTSFGDIADLAREAVYAVGNDTGPMHIIAAAGCRSVVLFSHASNPDLCAPRGNHVTIIRRPDLSTLSPDEVWLSLY